MYLLYLKNRIFRILISLYNLSTAYVNTPRQVALLMVAIVFEVEKWDFRVRPLDAKNA